MIKQSLIHCIEILADEHIITKHKAKELLKGIESGDKKAYVEISDCLVKLSREVKREMRK